MDLLSLLTAGCSESDPNALIVGGVYTNFRCRVLGTESSGGVIQVVQVRLVLVGRRVDIKLAPHQVRKDGHKIPGEGL